MIGVQSPFCRFVSISFLNYLIENEVRDSFDAMTKTLLEAMLTDRNKWLGLERWRVAVINEIQNFPEGFVSLNQRKQRLKSIYSTLAKYERFEVLSLLEEFLWSMKIDEAKSTESNLSRGEKRRKKKAKILDDSNKQAYRINSGADIVLSNVLPYLGEYYEEDSSEDEESNEAESEVCLIQ